ncbi:MAG TPA: DUF2950 domain-containing protein [Terriglobia bacterium]|nr:DUF2950 domain-containing protein [Terriglobia bacterium]
MSTWKTIVVKQVHRLLGFACLLTLAFGLLAGSLAGQQTGQKTFASPGDAAGDMIAAAKAGDTDALLQIFGPEGKELLSSGDDVADKNARNNVVQRYEQMHRLVREPDDTVTVYMGAENWPFPIPLLKKGNAWYFDTPVGKQEVLYRRIGKNELATIDVCHAIVDAQKQYQSETHDGESVKQYALKLVSDPGKHNGLYWKAAAGEPQSLIGPLIAEAAAAGYTRKQSGPTPFHGYIYKHLSSQGPAAPGGANDFVVDGKMTGGFAVLAYPVEYRNSGVMTFMVNQDGIVYQKDLGPDTAKIAPAMSQYNPDSSWQQAE